MRDDVSMIKRRVTMNVFNIGIYVFDAVFVVVVVVISKFDKRIKIE